MVGSSYDDVVYTASDFKIIDLGDGNDRFKSTGTQPEGASEVGDFLHVDLGDGDDIFIDAPAGTIVSTGAGADDVSIADGVGIDDLSAQDRLTFAGLPLFGGIRYAWMQTEWAISWGGLFHWGLNQQGELQVWSPFLGTTWILNWGASGGMDVPQSQRWASGV